MNALSIDTRREIVRRVFPELQYGGDPDLEKYFDLRKSGRLAAALALYNGPLRSRYPDDASRLLLLRLYREGNPRWTELQERLLLDIGEKIGRRIERNIDTLVLPLEKADLSDAFRALSAVEALLRMLPRDGDAALDFLNHYAFFANILDHRVKLMGRACDLVREYLEMARSDNPGEYDFVARSAALEEKRRSERSTAGRGAGKASAGAESWDFIARSEALEAKRRREEEARSRYFDLSRLDFTPADRKRIEIAEGIEKKEDRVLAFCLKYWRASADPGFERIVFLYSKKFGTRHYAILRAIKIGRAHHFTDDEILTAVSTILSSSYSYSVAGDVYMQTSWRRLKAGIEEAERVAAEAAVKASEPRSHILQRKTVSAKAEEPRRSARSAKPDLEARSRPVAAAGSAARAADEAFPQESPGKLPPEPRSRPSAPASAANYARSRVRDGGEQEVAERLAPSPSRPDVAELRAPPVAKAKSGDGGIRPLPSGARRARGEKLLGTKANPEPVPLIMTSGRSVSDRIRKLSGKAYDVYKEIFLERVRDEIHRTLLESRTGPRRLFDTSSNEAEDLIYAFLSTHYEDPFMDWESSEERRGVEKLGFALPSLDPVIEAWYKKL